MQIRFDPKKGIWADDEETVDKLKRNYFGREKGKIILLNIEEALYMMNFQNTTCLLDDKPLSFNDLASHYISREPRLFVRYNAYRDWRDRGLVILRSDGAKKANGKRAFKHYPKKEARFGRVEAKAQWYSDSMFSVMEGGEEAKRLFNDFWFGQYGIYKQDRGHLLKLNFLETVFLSKHMGVRVLDADGKTIGHEKLLNDITSRREYTKQLYDVYEDWRVAGFVVKTGFKFGSHFRIYFPGASPAKGGKWVHSKHVLHVFPKEQRLLISEWARVVRVAHSVKKTFILALPKITDKELVDYPADFVAYRRKKSQGQLVRETPEDGPRYLLAAVSEDEHIGGIELASLLKNAEDKGLELILSITDRESSVTYYLLKRIMVSDSGYEYYEIEWHKP
jgi:tRNA-intron endonuclease